MVIFVDKKSLFMDGFYSGTVSCVNGKMMDLLRRRSWERIQGAGGPPHFKKGSSYHFCIIFSKEQLTAT
jgi:hypothetical protein